MLSLAELESGLVTWTCDVFDKTENHFVKSAFLSFGGTHLSSPSIASVLVFPLPVHPSYDTASGEDPASCDFLWLATWFQEHSARI